MAEAINTTLDAGTYYIQVLAGGANTSTNYSLDIQAQSNPKTDLAWRNYSTGENAVWYMNGTTVTSGDYLLTIPDTNWRMEGLADFNGDGQADLVWRNYATGQNSVWQMNGTTLVNTLALPSVTDLNWLLEGSGDFNHDGQTDLVWRNYATGQDAIWLMQGATISAGVFFTSITDSNWHIEGVGDFNGDKQPDLVWRNYASGENSVWLMQETTVPAGVFLTPFAGSSWQITTTLTRFEPPARLDTAGNTTTAAFDLGSLNGSGTYKDFVHSTDTDDYYRFSVGSTTSLNLLLSRLLGDANVQLLKSSGSVLQSSSNSGIASESFNATLSAGTY